MRNKLTQDRPTLFMDQYGQTVVARNRTELREKVGGGSVSKMYVDQKDGRTLWIGYVVGGHWFTAFHRTELDTR